MKKGPRILFTESPLYEFQVAPGFSSSNRQWTPSLTRSQSQWRSGTVWMLAVEVISELRRGHRRPHPRKTWVSICYATSRSHPR